MAGSLLFQYCFFILPISFEKTYGTTPPGQRISPNPFVVPDLTAVFCASLRSMSPWYRPSTPSFSSTQNKKNNNSSNKYHLTRNRALYNLLYIAVSARNEIASWALYIRSGKSFLFSLTTQI